MGGKGRVFVICQDSYLQDFRDNARLLEPFILDLMVLWRGDTGWYGPHWTGGTDSVGRDSLHYVSPDEVTPRFDLRFDAGKEPVM